jgi:DNA polymerase III subunit gamma/tau
MTSLALYLKWRPRRFEDVVGQEHITRTLKNAMRGGRIAHAYLFTGPRGTGKTTMARLLAKAVNCLDEDVSNRPCDRCHICRSVNEGRLLDLIEMDAASHTGVDNVREAIRDKVGFRPSEARYKVYVIDEVHMLSTSAFNALLKTLEEPPQHVIFVLATTEPHRLLPTIVSRCQRFDFRRIPLSALVARLRHIADGEGIHISDGALQFIARTSTGSARDAISLLDQLTAYGDDEITVERLRAVLGYSDSEIVYQLVTHLCAHEIGPGLGIIQRAVEQGVEMRQFAQQIVDYARGVLLVRVGGELAADSLALDVDERTWTRMQDLARQFPVRDLLQAIKLFNQAQLELRSSDQSQLALELAFVEAAMSQEKPSPVTSTSAPVHSVQEARPVSSGAGSPPPAAPPKASSAVSKGETVIQPAVPEPERAPGGVAPEYIERMRAEVSSFLRAAGPSGRTADGFFGSVFAIGQIKVVGGNQVLLGLPQNVFDKVTDGINQMVQEALCSVLGKACQVRFVEKGALAGYAMEPRVTLDTEPGTISVATPIAAPVAAPVEGSIEGGIEVDEKDAQAVVSDPYLEAVSDPVIQDLVSRGGQVTGVQMLAEDE